MNAAHWKPISFLSRIGQRSAATSATGVTERDIVWCYRNLLGREPESESVVRAHAGYPSFQGLVRAFLNCEEFARKPRGFCAAGEWLEKSSGISFDASDIAHANKTLALQEFETGVLKVTSTPLLITLESSSRCNLRCVMCPHAIGAVERPKHLEEKLIGGLKEFLNRAESVQLHGIGEPLISPAFWKNLDCLSPECYSTVNTNMTAIDDQRLRRLISSNLKAITVSLDAARPETYAKIRRFSFEIVIANIRRFMAMRRDLGRQLPELFINMTLMRSNIEEVVEFIDLAVELGASRVLFWHLNRWSQAEMKRYVIERDGWTFNYANEGLWNFPKLSNDYLRKAQQAAHEKNVPLGFDQNKDMFFVE